MQRASAPLRAALLLGAALSAALPACLPRAGAPAPAASAAPELAARRQAFADLLAEHWEYTLRTNPELATILGDKRYDDQLSDLSQEGIDRHLAATAGFLSRFEAIDPAGFPVQEQLSHALMLRDLRLTLEGAPFEPWQMPVSQMSGLHLDAAGFVKFLSLEAVPDYENYLARLRQLPRQFEDVTAHMRAGLAAGLVPPRILLEKVALQAERIAAVPPEETPFAQVVAAFPASIPEAERARLRQAYLGVLGDAVLPAYARFARFVREEYAPRGRAEPGLWALPEGAERYAFLVRLSTTTAMTPEEIHQLGLSEVARIEKEMLLLAKRLGFQDLAGLEASTERNPRLRPRSREEILAVYRQHIDRMGAKLPALFGRRPKAGLEVRAVEAFREKEAAAAEYNQGTPDGSRPGLVLVNTGDFEKRKTLGFETTAYHEGLPGHHLQIALAQELPDLPPFRQQGGYTAYVEGWALYSERLGREVGFYEDPYSLYGHLTDEMLRAIRLVVDTGVHAKRWTREQMVRFFHDHSAIDEVEVQAETDRYIAWPAQALGYKIGQLRILALRERAQRALGPRFDLRAFHDEVLGAGALPLDVLEARIDAWIAARAGAPEAGNAVRRENAHRGEGETS